jgi:hypothetical protein
MMLDNWKRLLFNEGEWACASTDAFGISLISEKRISADYAFIAINPLLRGTSRADGNVNQFRNFLLEFDSGTVEEQRKFLDTKQVPYSSLVFSGSKSLHAIVCLEESLKNEREWRKYMQALLKLVPEADRSVSNPSRFSRMPNHLRADTKSIQTLIETRPRTSIKDLTAMLEPHFKVAKPKEMVVKAIENGAPLSAWTYQFLLHGAPSGERHKRAMMAAFDMVKCGWTPEEISSKLETVWPTAARNEIENIVKYAIQKSEGQ